jgi:hypothetical protein
LANTGLVDRQVRTSATLAVLVALIGAPATGREGDLQEPAEPSASADARRWVPVTEKSGVAVVENRRALPRAWLVSEVRSTSGKHALRTIRGETKERFDPRRTALLELGDAPMPTVGGLSPEDAAQVRVSANGRVVVDTRSARPGFLVVSETYFPGWEATVDGASVPIYQTNYLLLGVAVPPGPHRVEMRYRAPRATLGLMISCMTAAILTGLGVVTWRRRTAARTPSVTNEGAAV